MTSSSSSSSLSISLVVALLWSLSCLPTAWTFSAGAGDCPGGIPAVGAPHLTSTFKNGTLAEGGITVLLDDIALTPDGFRSFTIGQAHTLTLQSSTSYKGLLIRMGGVGIDALSPPTGDDLLQVASVCTSGTNPVSGVTHKSSVSKSASTINLLVNSAANDLPVDVTVVVSNSNGVSEFYYSSFVLNALTIPTATPVAPIPMVAPESPTSLTATPIAPAVPTGPPSAFPTVIVVAVDAPIPMVAPEAPIYLSATPTVILLPPPSPIDVTAPSAPTELPTVVVVGAPTITPTLLPSLAPTTAGAPQTPPTNGGAPTVAPTFLPSLSPTVGSPPSPKPVVAPSSQPKKSIVFPIPQKPVASSGGGKQPSPIRVYPIPQKPVAVPPPPTPYGYQPVPTSPIRYTYPIKVNTKSYGKKSAKKKISGGGSGGKSY